MPPRQMNSIETTNDPIRFDATHLRNFAHALLCSAGLPSDRAADVAEVLLEGDLLGHTTHGLALLALYLDELEKGRMAARGEPAVVADSGAALTWDGGYLPGPWLVRSAIHEAQRRLAQHPLVAVVIRRSHHIACLQAFLKPATDAGHFILLATSDPANRCVAPHGGVDGCYTPNPIAAGIPTGQGPLLIDISMSTTALGQVLRADRMGQRLPGNWVIARDGNTSDDPAVVTGGQGALLPLGGAELGYKGFALALIVEALTNALGGHGRADKIARWSNSVFLLVIDPARFGGIDAFRRETEFLAQACRASAVPPGAPPVRLPGDGALARRAEQLAHGVRLHPEIMPALVPCARKFGVSAPSALG